MKKKVYVQPSVSVYEMEAETILAGSIGVKAQMDDGTSIEYGGDTKNDEAYTPW